MRDSQEDKKLFLGVRMWQRDIDINRQLADKKYLLNPGDREYIIDALTKLAQLESDV